MKRKSVWLSFTACALTAASVPFPARASQRVETPANTQICRACPMRTGASLGISLASAWSESAKGASAYQPGATPQVSQTTKRKG